MSKHKKTRQQKIIADLRRKIQQTQILHHPDSSNFQKTVSFVPLVTQHTVPRVIEKTYPYLSHDLLKTTVATSSIVFLELFLFFLLKKHIIVLPMLHF